MIAGPGRDALVHVPGALVRGRIDAHLDTRPLHGGLTNRSFVVTTTAGRYVVRLGTAFDTLLAIDRSAETAAQRLAAAAGIAPAIEYADAASGLLITHYVEGRGWTPADFAAAAQIDRLGERLQQLHALETEAAGGLVDLDPVARAREYVAQIVAAAPDERAALERLLVEAERHRDESGGGTRAPCLVHSDLHGSNLVDGRALWLIDWEYAALADPLHDVASVLAYHPQAAPFAPRLLAALGLAAEPRALAAALWLFRLLVHLWYRARRVAVEPSAADLAAEQGAARALVHNRNL